MFVFLCKADKNWHLFWDSLCTRSVQLQFILQVADSSLKIWLDGGVNFLFFRIWLTPCSLLALWVARKLSKWTCADSDILCRAPVFFLSPEKIRFRHLQSANISNPQTKICSLIARKTYTGKVNLTKRPNLAGGAPLKLMKRCNFPPETNLQRVSFLENVFQFHQSKPEREICADKKEFLFKLCIYLGLFGSSNSYTTFPFMSGSAVAHLHQRNVDS